MESGNKERIKSVLSFILLTMLMFSVMKWVLPRFGIRT